MLLSGTRMNKLISLIGGGQGLVGIAQLETDLGLEVAPGFFSGLDEAEELQIECADHAGLVELLEVDQLGPELAAEQQYRAAPRLAGLDQRERLEHLVECAEAAGKAHQRHRSMW